MRLCVLDFETYWSVTHSLTKMNPIEYVMHPETEIISVAAKFDDGPTQCLFGGDKIRSVLSRIDWSDTMVVGHNMSGFDAMILAWRLGVKPKMWGCTLAMSRPFFQTSVGGSLKKVAAALGLGEKGSLEATNTKGKHLADFTPEEITAMEEYNKLDVDLCHGIFMALAPKMSKMEMQLIDRTIRMLTEPTFELDIPLLERTLEMEHTRKHEMLLTIARQIGVDTSIFSTPEDVVENASKILASSAKFSELLRSRGVEVPMKPSPTNPEKMTPALAKTDEEFIALQEHEDAVVSAAARARLGVKSTLLESRISQFLKVGKYASNKMPVFLNYYAAVTGRWGGSGGLNQQNMPRIPRDKEGNIIDKPTNALRMCLRAPEGEKIVVCDLSGIELRVNHFLWKVPSSMALYEADPVKADLYKHFAGKLYEKPESEVTKGERQVGKVCLAEGTLVLTSNGLKPIESVSVLDLLWDGVEWVTHDGPAYMGVKEVISYDGIEATPDHDVWVEDGRKVQFGYAAAQSLRLARTGAGRSPLGFGGAGEHSDRAEIGVPLRASTVHELWDGEGDKLRQSTGRQNEWMPVVQPEMRCADVVTTKDGSRTTTVHEPERSVVQELRWAGDHVRFPVSGVSGCMGDGKHRTAEGYGARPDRQQQGLQSGEPSMGIAEAEHGEPEGFTQQAVPSVSAELSGSALRGQHTSHLATFGVDGRGDHSAVPRTIVQTKRRVWDIRNAGPRHRFTANDRLVSNCHLGLGFGSGAVTFQKVAKLMGGVSITLEESQDIVAKWRSAYREIKEGWRQCGYALAHIVNGEYDQPIDPWGLCRTMPDGIKTPVGAIRYPGLHVEDDGAFWYGEGRNRTRLTGPKVDENIVQHLARCVLAEQLLKISKRYKVIHTVHDEIICSVPDARAEECLDFMVKTMSTPPEWWPEIILSSEGDIADTYGNAK